MTVVVTGAAGFVGLNLVNRLAEEGYEVKALDLSFAKSEHTRVNWSKCDVTNRNNILKFLNKDIEIVYHLAGVVGVKNYLTKPTDVLNVNFESTRYIVEAARKYGFTILFASTSEIYGKNPLIPWKEDDDRVLGSTRRSRWIYSTSKALSEHLLFEEAENSGIRNIIVRFFNLYGPYQKPINVIPRMISSLIINRKLSVYDQGDQTRCFTYVDDAIDAILALVKSQSIENEAFNIDSNVETRIKDLAQQITEIFSEEGLQIETVIPRDTLGENYEDVGRRVPDVSKIYQKTGWKAMTSLTEGLKKTIRWYKDNYEWWRYYF